MFKRLGIKQTGESSAKATFKRTIKGDDDAYYSPSIPSEETSAFTKRIKLEETSKNLFILSIMYFYFFVIEVLTTVAYFVSRY